MVNVWFLDQKYILDTLSSATSYEKLDANIQIIFGTVCALDQNSSLSYDNLTRLFLGQCVPCSKKLAYIVFVICCKEFDPHLLGTVCALVQRWLCLQAQISSLSSVIRNMTHRFLEQCVPWSKDGYCLYSQISSLSSVKRNLTHFFLEQCVRWSKEGYVCILKYHLCHLS